MDIKLNSNLSNVCQTMKGQLLWNVFIKKMYIHIIIIIIFFCISNIE